MGGVCGKYETQQRCIAGFWWEELMDRDHVEDLGVDGRIILKWISKYRGGSTDWIHMAPDRDRWQ
jgi:hypothetical protein